MGEAKRKLKQFYEELDRITKGMVDKGQLVTLGFVAYLKARDLQDAHPAIIEEHYIAYISGAEHLFMSIMNILDPGEEPTLRDMERMDSIGMEVLKLRGLLAAKIYGQ